VVFTNGQSLSRELAVELKRAGVHQLFFHVDSGQRRPGWEGRSEAGLNELRAHYADLLWDLGGVQCGFNMTISRKTLPEVPDVVEWVRRNLPKVQNVSLIALRGLSLAPGKTYMANGKLIDTSAWQSGSADEREITLTSEEVYETVAARFPDFVPAACLTGTARPDTYKFLITLYLGSLNGVYGAVGAKAVELNEVWLHLRHGRYLAGVRDPVVGKRMFLLSVLDRGTRRAFLRFLAAAVKAPGRLADRISIQCINIQQPNEILDGETNLCDGCLNQMVYRGEMIPSCKLDEYRLFGGPIVEVTATRPPA
jgi:hypothetical protein